MSKKIVKLPIKIYIVQYVLLNEFNFAHKMQFITEIDKKNGVFYTQFFKPNPSQISVFSKSVIGN